MSLPDELKNRFRIIQFVETEAKALLPTGSNNQIQFNESGGFGASPNLTFLKDLSYVGIGTSNPNYPLEIIAERQQLRIAENDTDNTTFDHRNGRLAISVDGGGDPLLIDARHVQVGNSPNAPTAKTAFEVHYSGAEGNLNPARAGNLSDNEGGGEVVYFGTSSAEITQGKLYFLKSDGLWEETTADNKASGSSQLLAISIGTVPGRDGMLMRGFFDAHTYLTGTFTDGAAVYVSPDLGYIEPGGPPLGSGRFIRIVGYMTTLANVIYFNPGHTYVEVS